ncbi:MAG: S8 family serine peptidase, partial [candidate division Zixibacteria bacterium]|nr:S8 family serine peptidase [candidate division Zixibacteria bacterium]
ADLVSYLWWNTASQAQNEYAAAITLFNGKISNNSWGLGAGGDATQYWCEGMMGNYLAENTTIDNIVRGGTSRPWVICWSAGNQRGYDPDYCGYLGWTYNTVGGYANSKNIITVGAINSTTDAMLGFSSWGPCDDGRLKPDVVAPGCMYSTYYPGDGYYTLCGTSMSSPAVAGIVTLLMQQAEASYPGRNLLSSTFKGLLINTAADLGAPGPDYQFGHGKVQGLAAVSKLVDGDSSSFIESVISGGQAHLYDLTLPATDELRVTLVWDDPGATVLSGPVLVNDLDLVVIDPQSGEEYPWVLDGGNPGAFATRGADHINNVESITIPNPYPGLWKARVTGFNVPSGPQKYSLIFSPDGIHTPGQYAALAVFDSDDATIDPGQSTLVEFWAVNVGADADSVRVQIGDNQGWIDASVDSVVNLDPLDSAYFSVTATVPSDAMAWEEDSVLCTATSKTDPDIYTTGRVVVGTAAYYTMAVTAPENGSANSPDTIQFDVWVKNLGNDYDDLKASCSDELGWNIYPQYIWTYDLTPGDSAMVTFNVAVPAEEADLDENTVMVNGVTAGGASDQASFVLTVSNPYPPPSLLSPDDDTYTQDRTHAFSWDGVADSYSLYISSNETMTALQRVYTGITQMTFTMPEADSLADGGYFWAVRKYVGADSSSLQRYPRKIVVDNVPPSSMTPTYPVGGIFVGQANFLFYFAGGKITTERAPEYGVIEMCQDSSFAANVRVFEPVTGNSYQMQETLEQGRWYWRMQRRDKAGNASAYSQKVNFILDSEEPPIPTLLKPANGGTAGGASVTFQWATDAPSPYEESAEYYHLQISETSNFTSTEYSDYVFNTTLNVSAGYFLEGSQYFWRVSALDSLGHVSSYQTEPFSFTMLGFVCGDANANGAVNISDVSYLVAFLFGIPTGPPPIPFVAGDQNGDGKVNVSDVSYLVAYLFASGSPPNCP